MKRIPLRFALAAASSLRADQVIYDDALRSGWQDWGWAPHNYSNSSPVLSGTYSVSVSISNNTYQGLQIYHPDMDSTPYTNLTFWINGGAGGQKLQVYGLLHVGGTPNADAGARYSLGTLPAGTWQQFVIPLSALSVDQHANFTGIVIQDAIGAVQPTFYVDDISLVTGFTGGSPGTNAPIRIGVDALVNRHPISPLIYGSAFASSNELAELNFTVNRSGGNNQTRYNWQLNAHNIDADWYFESVDDGSPTSGAATDGFILDSRNGGAEPMVTIPMIGWAARLNPDRSTLHSYSVAKYGPQTGADPWQPDAGNGIGTNTALHTSWLITTNDPNDANFPTIATFQQGYVQHLMNLWGASTNGGVRFYLLDNECSLWFSTHRDVHPIGPSMQEIWTNMLVYASMVKSNDPNALIAGPEEWGWSGYFYSGYDQQWAGQNGDYDPAHYPDRNANGGADFSPWLLNLFHQHEISTGRRLLDYFTLHCYPQEDGVGSADISASTSTLRNQSTRQFWDTNYVDPSWINSVIKLIPRMKNWVATNYPGTKIGVTEYNWGAEDFINGATAQADLLGIFGREGLDLATRWTTPDATTPTFKAMKLYRNYDGNKSTFGETSVLTTMPNPDVVAAFGAQRSVDGALTLMVVNKDLGNVSPITANFTNLTLIGTAQRWQLTASNVIAQLPNLALTNAVLRDSLPSQSITLYVLPVPQPFQLQLKPDQTPGGLSLTLNGQPGASYTMQSSTDLIHWLAFSTNTLTTNSVQIVVATTNSAQMFYRGVFVQP